MSTDQIANTFFAIATLVMGLFCLFTAESIDAARVRAPNGSIVHVAVSEKILSISFYLVASLVTASLLPSWTSSAALLGNSLKAFAASMLPFSAICIVAIRAHAPGFASRSAAAAARATGIFVINLSIFYATRLLGAPA